MKRLDFIKKIGLATVGLPLLSSFELSKEHLFVADQEEREKFDFELYEIVKSQKNGKYEFPNGNIIWVMEYDEQEKISLSFSQRECYTFDLKIVKRGR